MAKFQSIAINLTVAKRYGGALRLRRSFYRFLNSAICISNPRFRLLACGFRLQIPALKRELVVSSQWLVVRIPLAPLKELFSEIFCEKYNFNFHFSTFNYIVVSCKLITFNLKINNSTKFRIFAKTNCKQTKHIDMISKELLNPRSIVVVGASADIHKPGGHVLLNLKNSNFKGTIYAVNPKEDEVQGIKCTHKVEDLPQVDCAILAIAAKYCPATVDVLAKEKGTKGFIILSAGFAEENAEGAAYERHIADTINSVGGSLIGPNCTGFLNTNYCGAFDAPIPPLDPHGVDFVTGSGATAVFIKE